MADLEKLKQARRLSGSDRKRLAELIEEHQVYTQDARTLLEFALHDATLAEALQDGLLEIIGQGFEVQSEPPGGIVGSIMSVATRGQKALALLPALREVVEVHIRTFDGDASTKAKGSRSQIMQQRLLHMAEEIDSLLG